MHSRVLEERMVQALPDVLDERELDAEDDADAGIAGVTMIRDLEGWELVHTPVIFPCPLQYSAPPPLPPPPL
jgi:hypothetical protein